MDFISNFKKIAISFPNVEEQPHFEKTSFRIKKKIFATLEVKNLRVCLKLSISDQDLFTLYDKSTIYPVPNKWGKQGWTFVELASVKPEMLQDAVTSAYNGVNGNKTK